MTHTPKFAPHELREKLAQHFAGAMAAAPERRVKLKKSGRMMTVRTVAVAVGVGPTIQDAFPNNPPPMAGYIDESGKPALLTPTITDINQGWGEADCWWIAPLGAIADGKPAYIPVLCRNDLDATGAVIPNRYVIYLFGSGVVVRYHEDALIDGYQNRPDGPDGDFWPALFEKALAMHRSGMNTFDSTGWGYSSEAFRYLGIPVSPSTRTVAGIRAAMVNAVNVATLETGNAPRADMVHNHVYAFLSLANQNQDPMKLDLYNPWGDASNSQNPRYITITDADFKTYPGLSVVFGGPIVIPTLPDPSQKPPTITTFTATPSQVMPGQSFQLLWQTEGATSVTLDGNGTGATSGLEEVTTLTATRNFTLVASNAYGSVTKTITVTVTSTPNNPALAMITLAANPPSLPKGGGTTVVSWSVTSGSALSTIQLDGANVAASGSKAFAVHNQAMTLTLVAVNAGGMAKQTITIAVAKH